MESDNVTLEDALRFFNEFIVYGLELGGIIYLLTKACSFVFEMILYFSFCFFYPLKRAQPKKVIWFTRRIVNVSSQIVEDEFTTLIDAERSKCSRRDIVRKALLNFLFGKKLIELLFKKRNDETTLWIPLNDNESNAIEGYYLSRTTRGRRPPIVMNGLFKVSDKSCQKLTSIHWEHENAVWLLMRGEYVCEIPSSPPPLYFMNIKPDITLKSFYQPVFESDKTSVNDEYDFSKFRAIDKTNNNQHIIFVIHGIGHHEGEEGIVENANDIREGFVKYLKKHRPDSKTPIVIPIAWRYKLSKKMGEDKIRAAHLLKYDWLQKCGTIFDDLFLYCTNSQQDIKNEVINQLNEKYAKVLESIGNERNQIKPKVSILAHSLGSVIAFDILQGEHELEEEQKKLKFDVKNLFLIGSPLARFLSYTNKEMEKIKTNPLVKDGKLFNIINLDDPVAHRFETLFNSDYQYVEPLALFLEKSTENTLEISSNEKIRLAKFDNKLTKNRELANAHDCFYQVDFLKPDIQNNCATDADPPSANISESLKKKFSETKIISAEQLDQIDQSKRIPHRFDYNLFHKKYHGPQFINFDTYEGAKEHVRSHSSYWKSQETVAFMTNIIYGSGQNIQRQLGKPTKNIKSNKWATIALVILRLLCPICFIFHSEPLFEPTIPHFVYWYKSQLNYFFMCIFVGVILVDGVFIVYFEKEFKFLRRKNCYVGMIIYAMSAATFFYFGHSKQFHKILYSYFLIFLSLVLPNLHMLVGLIWNIFDLLGKTISKLYIYLGFILPAFFYSFICYIFQEENMKITFPEDVIYIFCKTYTFTLLFGYIFHIFIQWSSPHISSDKLKHVPSPDKPCCYRANILCNSQSPNEADKFGSITTKRFSSEVDNFDKICFEFGIFTILCYFLYYIFSSFWN